MPTWFEKMLNSQYVMVGLAILAFLVALWLVMTIVRMLAGGGLKLPGNRTRQPRLGIVDAFDLDRQRQLIIVRRDNTEHLIMIGGPNDLVIESEIVRIETRDARRDKAGDTAGPSVAMGEMRIPAPFAAVERADTGQAEAPVAQNEPLLPMALPAVMPPQPVPAAAAGFEAPGPTVRGEPLRTEDEALQQAVARPPTFPLPPRRPAPPQERRAAIAPRASEPPMRAEAPVAPRPIPQPAASAVPPHLPTAAAAPGNTPSPPTDNAAGSDAADPAVRPAVRPAQPPFLKPMPPRAPLRPLPRATPQVSAPAAGQQGVPRPTGAIPPTKTANPQATGTRQIEPVFDVTAAPPPPDEPVVAAPMPTPPPPAPSQTKPAIPPVVPEDPATSKDALESLEEEMAKLLGRG